MTVNLSLNPTCANNTTDWRGGANAWSRQTGVSVGDTGRTTCGRIPIPTGAWPNIGTAATMAASSGTTGGLTFSYVARVRASVTRSYRHAMIRRNGTGYTGDVFGATTQTLTANVWTTVRGVGTVPTGGTYDAIGFHNDFPTTGTEGNLDVGAVRFLQGDHPTLEFADGDSAGWTWDGTAGNSTSQEQAETPINRSDALQVSDTATADATIDVADSATISESVAVGIPIDRDDSLTVTDAAAADAETVPQDTTTTTESVTFDADLGVSDSATVVEQPHVQGSFPVDDVPFTVTEQPTIINVAQDGHVVAEDVDLTAHLGVGDSWTLAEGAVVQERYGDLLASIWAVDHSTGALHALPDFTELNLAPTRNGPGTIGLTYPKIGVNAHLLAATVAADRDLQVEIWTTGSPLGARRGYLQEAAGDDVAEDDELWTFAGGFAELRMSEARVWPQPLVGEISLGDNVSVKQPDVTTAQWNRLVGPLGFVPTDGGEDGPTLSVPQKVLDAVKANAADIPVLADPKRELVLAGASPGDAMHLLLAQARSRGALTDITTSFTGTHDSAGVAWTQQVSARVSPGATYESVLNMLASLGRVEWSVTWNGTQQVLNLFRAEGRGVDRTVGLRPVVLRASRNIAEAPRKWSIRSASTAMGAAGAEGVYADTNNLDAQSRRGRRIEGWTSSQNLTTEDAVLAYAQRRLGSDKDGTLEVTHGLALVPGEPRPVVAFDVGDWVYSQTATDLERYRVVEWSLTVDAERRMTATVTLNDAFVDELVRQRQYLDAISAGEVVTGTSEPGESHTGFPMPPTGLVISSGAFNTGIDAYAVVNLGWIPPVINTNGTALTDLQGFRVEWTEEANWEAWRFAADVGANATSAQWTTAINLPIRYRVRAYNRSGRSSEWATGSTVHTTESDTDPPGVPSAPVGGGGLGLIDFRWDGLTEDGADMLQAYPDFKWVELHLSTSSMFTPSQATLADHILGKGTYTYSQLPDGTALNYETTYFCRLVAVDRLDNASASSGQGSAVPGQVLSPDIFDGAVGSVKLADAAVVTAKIANLAVTDAKIQNLSVGKLTAGILEASMIIGTGKIATGTTGARSELDSAGFRLYNAANQMTVQLSSANGSAMIAGEYRTSLTTGLRLVFNPNGTSPDEIRFYPANTNQYGYIRTVTSTSPIYPNQAGLMMKAHTGRTDEASGQLQVFPDYASLNWGLSYVQTVPHQIGMRAPRFHIGMPRASGFALNSSEDEILRIGVSVLSTGNFIDKTVITYRLSTADEPAWIAENLGSGLAFGPGFVGSVRGDFTGYNPIRASAFTQMTSLRATKQDFTELAYPGGPLGALQRAPVQKWRRIIEVEQDGDTAEWHLGAMADDLPPEVVRGDPETGQVGYALDSLVGLIHAAVNQLADRVTDLERRPLA